MLCYNSNSCSRRRNTEIQSQLKSKLGAWIIFLLPAIMLLHAYWKHRNFHTGLNRFPITCARESLGPAASETDTKLSEDLGKVDISD